MLREDYDGALVAATGVSGGADAALIPRLITGFATGLQAMALVHRGEAARALSFLDGVESLGEHALCFDLQRATAYLQLGENREALICTDSCIRMGAAHNLRTLSSILLRRAIANHRLGYVDVADNAFSEAFGIMVAAGAMTPLLGLAQEELELLLGRLVTRRPDLTQLVDDVRCRAEARPRNQALVLLPSLTRRESVVADRLRSNLPLADIAESLFVSANTLKSQVHSLYVKLGASSRDEAVALLERGGFYERTHPQQERP
jgi:DNA-binding CsgD family transcriptional regulator